MRDEDKERLRKFLKAKYDSVEKELKKSNKVRILDLIKFFLVCWIASILTAITHEFIWLSLTGEFFSQTERFVSVFGWCIIFMLIVIWKEIKEAKQID